MYLKSERTNRPMNKLKVNHIIMWIQVTSEFNQK